jgi:phage shock protein A
MLEQSVREMLDNLRSLREATATTIAFETKAKRDLDAQNARVRNLDKQAEEGLRQGNEKLARRALQLQVEAKGTRERADQTYKASKLRADNARAKLTVEEERVQGKIRQLGELKAIHQMNEAQRRMQSITDEYNIDGAVNVFDKTAGSIQEQADKLSAMDTIAVSEGEDLDRQLAAISQKTDVDAALDAMKARLAEAPTSSAAPAKERQKISSAFDEK